MEKYDETTDLPELLAAVEAGNVDAACELAWRYRLGFGGF